MDGHDGRDDLSRALDPMCGPGRLIVAAAGNEGEDAMHARQAVATSGITAFDIRVEPISSGLSLPAFLLSGWYEGSGRCRVRMVSSLGQATPWQSVGAPVSATMLGQDEVTVATGHATAGNPDLQFLVQVRSRATGQRVQGGTWRVEVRRSSGTPGTLHLWLLRGRASPQAVRFLAPAFSELIGSPGAATEVVTVASFTSRHSWVDVGGRNQATGMPLNTVSPFSSPGPRRDGAPKPDVTAPGAMIVSGESAHWNASAAQQSSTRIAAGWRVDAGTSMASPFIAGTLACLLGQRPQLTPAQAKAWLKARSRVPGQPPGSHDRTWGFGLLKV
jgi:subtilisin family serine protease